MNPIIASDFSVLKESVDRLDIPHHRVCIVADSHTGPLYAEDVKANLRESFTEVHEYIIPAGEEQKTLDTVRSLLRYLIEHHFDRKDCLVALGGGVIGDMAGFAASVYLRGIPVIQIPTTLLAQIDSSIGGKTAVDFDGFKNMVGAFHMPTLIYTNTSVLKSLPEEQIVSGMGEIIKSGLLGDISLYTFLKEHREEILRKEDSVMTEVIGRTAQIKVDIVQRDPTEKGERALLNLGHTIGHAVEKYKNFALQHGTCVGLGLIAAAYLSYERGYLTAEELEDIKSVCASYALPLTTDGLDPDEILQITKSDKKMSNGQIRFVLLEKPGKAILCDDLKDEELLRAIHYIMKKEEGIS